MEGWIKLHRKFLSWEWFDISDMIKLFIFLLLSSNHDDNTWRGIEIKRGQYLTGLNSLSDKTKISIQTLRTCLKRLENTGEINMQVTNKYRLITICNYESYQDSQQATNNQPNKQLTSNQQATNSKQECKKEENEKKEYIYSQFYDSEISKATNQNYTNFVKYLFGENMLDKKLVGVLSIDDQLSFKDYLKISNKCEVNKLKLGQILTKIENDKKYYKGKTNLYRTLLNWAEGRFAK